MTAKVGNIWFLNPLVLSKWEDLAFSVCMLFEESVFIFQFLNNKMHNYVLFNTFVHFFIRKLKKNTFFSKLRENLVFILFEENTFIFKLCLALLGGKYLFFFSSRSVKMRGFSFLSLYKSVFNFQFLNVKMYNYGKQNTIVNFIIKKLKKTQFPQKV